MDLKQLEDIANRKTTCHTWGETVSISRAERDQLVAMGRLVLYPLVLSALEAAFEQRPGYLKLVSAAIRAWPESAIAEIGKNMEKV